MEKGKAAAKRVDQSDRRKAAHSARALAYGKTFNGRLKSNLRNRLNQAIKHRFKSGSAVRDLGCTIEELKVYLESKFQPGMTWENWGRGVDCWSIDHIKPLSKFDLADRKQLLEACHYTNLQPMWYSENSSKQDFWIEP